MCTYRPVISYFKKKNLLDKWFFSNCSDVISFFFFFFFLEKFSSELLFKGNRLIQTLTKKYTIKIYTIQYNPVRSSHSPKLHWEHGLHGPARTDLGFLRSCRNYGNFGVIAWLWNVLINNDFKLLHTLMNN